MIVKAGLMRSLGQCGRVTLICHDYERHAYNTNIIAFLYCDITNKVLMKYKL